jgi:type I restriction enzyme S subunit
MSSIMKVPFDKAYLSIPVGKLKILESNYMPSGKNKIIDQGQKLIAGYSSSDDFLRTDIPYIVFGDHTRVVKFVDFPFIVGADGVRLYKASQDFDPEYLFYFLKSAELPNDGYSRHSKHLEKLLVPKFQLNEQRQIVSRLKAQLVEIEKANKAIEMQLNDARLFVKKQQEHAIDLLKNVERVPLSKLLKGIETGKSLKTSELRAKENEFGVLKVSAVSWNKFQPNEAKSLSYNYLPPEKHRIKRGDFIISRANTMELVGAVVLVDKDYPFRLLSDKTLRLKVDKEQVMPEYLLHILKLSEARSHIETNASGTSNSMRNISQQSINSIPIPLAKKNLQKTIADMFNEANEQFERIEKAIHFMKDDLEILPKKLLDAAFA